LQRPIIAHHFSTLNYIALMSLPPCNYVRPPFSSSGIKFTANFVELCPLIQELKRCTQTTRRFH